MFGRKKTDEQPQSTVDDTVEINTLPSEFYAGANPVVTFKKVEKHIDISKNQSLLSLQDKKILDKQTSIGAHEPLHPINLLANKKFLAAAAVGLFVLVGGATAIYYIFFQTNTKKPPIVFRPTSTPPDSGFPTSSPPIDVPTSTVSTTPPVIADGKLEFPSVILSDSIDADKDTLTDKEEEVFATDPGVADTDSDGYSDGHEVFYMYNPAGKEPERLIDAGTAQEFANPNYGYKLFFPTTWKLGVVDSDFKDVLLSTITGEFIEIRSFEKNIEENFTTWFARVAPQEKLNDIEPFESYFKEKGWQREDGLVYYFVTQSRVYVIVYHAVDSTVNYRSIIKTIARSFRVDTTETTIREPLIPTPTSVSSTMSTISAPSTARTSTTSLRDRATSTIEKTATSTLTTTSPSL